MFSKTSYEDITPLSLPLIREVISYMGYSLVYLFLCDLSLLYQLKMIIFLYLFKTILFLYLFMTILFLYLFEDDFLLVLGNLEHYFDMYCDISLVSIFNTGRSNTLVFHPIKGSTSLQVRWGRHGRRRVRRGQGRPGSPRERLRGGRSRLYRRYRGASRGVLSCFILLNLEFCIGLRGS